MRTYIPGRSPAGRPEAALSISTFEVSIETAPPRGRVSRELVSMLPISWTISLRSAETNPSRAAGSLRNEPVHTGFEQIRAALFLRPIDESDHADRSLFVEDG